MSKEPTIIELDMDDLKGLLRRAGAKQFNDQDYETAQTVLLSYVELVSLLKEKNISMRRLQKMLFGASTEKTADVVGSPQPQAGSQQDEEPTTDVLGEADAGASPPPDEPAEGKGHGRNGADAYHGAETIEVPHESLEAGDPCPDCQRGTLYEMPRPGVLVRITGMAPIGAKIYRLQKFRCHLCGKIFTAETPEGVGPEKYDATVASMIALLKYGSGMPFNRCEGLQGKLGIPLPASTQWDLVHARAKDLKPAYAELLRQAAQGEVVYNDDTTARILERMGKRAQQNAPAKDWCSSTKARPVPRAGPSTTTSPVGGTAYPCDTARAPISALPTDMRSTGNGKTIAHASLRSRRATGSNTALPPGIPICGACRRPAGATWAMCSTRMPSKDAPHINAS